jgi:threonyl-tRNA synthetase
MPAGLLLVTIATVMIRASGYTGLRVLAGVNRHATLIRRSSGRASAVATEELVLPTNKDCDNLLRIRHTTAHVMAMAVQRTFPGVQTTIGPWIDNGFYYDFFNPSSPFSDTDLVAIKKEMDSIIKKKYPLVRAALAC